jgi:hypothetical protein
MTAGMVRVPTIVPLRPPSNSRKNMIDTQTPIEILSGMHCGVWVKCLGTIYRASVFGFID